MQEGHCIFWNGNEIGNTYDAQRTTLFICPDVSALSSARIWPRPKKEECDKKSSVEALKKSKLTS